MSTSVTLYWTCWEYFVVVVAETFHLNRIKKKRKKKKFRIHKNFNEKPKSIGFCGYMKIVKLVIHTYFVRKGPQKSLIIYVWQYTMFNYNTISKHKNVRWRRQREANTHMLLCRYCVFYCAGTGKYGNWFLRCYIFGLEKMSILIWWESKINLKISIGFLLQFLDMW